MATFIKLEQSGSELLRRNQEQAQAARLAKLESDEQARTEKEAKRQRQAELQRQGLDASGNALGDSRRRQSFRRDEPAASLPPYRVLLIDWNSITPSPSDPAAIVTDIAYQPSDYLEASDIQGTPALGITSRPPLADAGYPWPNAGSWTVASRSLAKLREDFTLEAWAAHGMEVSNIDLGLYWPRGDVAPYGEGVALRSLAFAGGFALAQTVQFGDVGSSTFVDNFPQLSIGQPFHLCIQRRGGFFDIYLNGTRCSIEDYRPDAAQMNIGADPTVTMFVASGDGLSGMSKLGQVRFTAGRARYPQAGFTPDAIPLLKR